VILAATAFLLLDGAKSHIRNQHQRQQVVLGVFAIWFVVYFVSGMFTTYSRNALSSSVWTELHNLIVFGVSAYLFEYVRYATLVLAGRRNMVWFGVVVAIFYGLALADVSRFSEVTNIASLVKLMVSYMMPIMSVSYLMTYLMVTSGFRTAVTLRLGLVASSVVLPIIPKYDWYLTGLSMLLLAISVFVALEHLRRGVGAERHVRHLRLMHRFSDAIMLLAIVGLVGFMTNTFPYHPLAVMSNSMLPVFSRGSLVIVQARTPSMDIQVGDIVQYRGQDRTIIHRVVDIETGEGERIFYTKGDNNPSFDSPVSDSQIDGIVRATVPFIGLPTVWLNSGLSE
jgi:signal peptidase